MKIKRERTTKRESEVSASGGGEEDDEESRRRCGPEAVARKLMCACLSCSLHVHTQALRRFAYKFKLEILN